MGDPGKPPAPQRQGAQARDPDTDLVTLPGGKAPAGGTPTSQASPLPPPPPRRRTPSAPPPPPPPQAAREAPPAGKPFPPPPPPKRDTPSGKFVSVTPVEPPQRQRHATVISHRPGLDHWRHEVEKYRLEAEALNDRDPVRAALLLGAIAQIQATLLG